MFDPKHFWVKKLSTIVPWTIGSLHTKSWPPTMPRTLRKVLDGWRFQKLYWEVPEIICTYTKFSVLLWAKALVLAQAQAEQMSHFQTVKPFYVLLYCRTNLKKVSDAFCKQKVLGYVLLKYLVNYGQVFLFLIKRLVLGQISAKNTTKCINMSTGFALPKVTFLLRLLQFVKHLN